MSNICDLKNGKITNPEDIDPIVMEVINEEKARIEIEDLEARLQKMKDELKARTGATLERKQLVETPAINAIVELHSKGEPIPPELAAVAAEEKFSLTGSRETILKRESLKKAPDYIKNEQTGKVEPNPEKVGLYVDDVEGKKQIVIDSTQQNIKRDSKASIINIGNADKKTMQYNSSKQDEFRRQFAEVKKVLGDDIPTIFEATEQLIGQGNKGFPLIKFRNGRAATVDGPKTRFAMKDLLLKKINVMTDDQKAKAKVLMNKIDEFEVFNEDGTTPMSSAIGSLQGTKNNSLTKIKEEIEDQLTKDAPRTTPPIDYEAKFNELKEKLNNPDELKKALAKLDEDIQSGKVIVPDDTPETRKMLEDEAVNRAKKDKIKEEVDNSEMLTPKEKEDLKTQIDNAEEPDNDTALKNFIRSMDKKSLSDKELGELADAYNKVTDLFDEDGNPTWGNPGEVSADEMIKYAEIEKNFFKVRDSLKYKNGRPWADTLWGQYKLGALQSPKSVIAGITLDLTETVTGPIKRRAMIGTGSDARPDIVPKTKDLVARDVEVRFKTGMDIVKHQFLDGRTRINGELENRLIPMGERKGEIGKLVQGGINLMNNVFLEKGLGVPDQAKSSYAFYDSAGLLITKTLDEAKVKRGTPDWDAQYLTLWKDINNPRPLTPEGIDIRNEALLFSYDSIHTPTPAFLRESKYLPQEGLPFAKMNKTQGGDLKQGTLPQLFTEGRKMLDDAGQRTLNYLSGGRINKPFPIGTMLMKYTGTPARAAQKFALDSTGASLLYKGIASMGKSGKKLTRGDVVAPAIGWSLGASLATLVDVDDYYGFWNSGGSSEKKDQMDLENARPGMVKINGNWVDTELLGPGYVPFHIVMTLKSSQTQSPAEGIVEWATKIATVGATVNAEAFLNMLPLDPTKEMGDFSNGALSFLRTLQESGEEVIETKDFIGAITGLAGAMTRSFTPAGIRDFVLANTDINLDADDDPTKLALREYLGDSADDVIDLTRWAVGGGELDLSNVDARGIYQGEGDDVLEGLWRQVFFGHRVLKAESSQMVEEIVKLNQEGYIFAPKNYVLSQKTFEIPEEGLAEEAKEYGRILETKMVEFIDSSEYMGPMGDYVETDPKERAESLMKVQKSAQKEWARSAKEKYKTLKEIKKEAEQEEEEDEFEE